MAADGSVIIEIEGNASDIISEFRRVASAAENIESLVKQIASAFREASGAAEDFDAGQLEDASDAADKLDQNLGQAASAADRLESSLNGDISGDLKKASSEADELGDSIDGAARAAQRLKDNIGGADGSAKKLSGGFTVMKGTAATALADVAMRGVDAFFSIGAEAINAADALTKFGSTMEFAGFDSSAIEASKEAVQDYAARTVYDLETVSNTSAQLAANGIADYTGLTEAAGNLNAVAGGNAATFQSVAMMLTQTAGAGKLTTENWNQLADAIPGASGELQEAMLANGAYTGNFRKAMEEGQITAEEFNQAIMQLGMSDAAIEAASSVSTVEGAVGNLKATLVDGLTGLLTDGGGMEAVTGFINGITSVLETAGTYIGPIIDEIKTAFSSMSEAFSNAFTSDQQSAILGFLKQLAAVLIAAPFKVVSLAVQALAAAFNFLVEVGAGIVNFFTSLPEKVASAGEKFSEIKTAISDAASGAVEAVDNFFSELPGNIENFISEALAAVVEWAGNMISRAGEAGSGFISSVGSFLASIPGKVASWISGAIESVVAWGNSMRTRAGEKMQEVATTIKDKLLSLPGELLTIGGQIVDGLINGITGGASRVANAISNMATTAINTAKSILGIASPSKVFAGIGAFTSEGFAEGILGGLRYVDAAVGELAAETKRQVEDLNAEIEKMEVEAAERKAKEELEAHEKALDEQYKKLESAELKEREKIQQKISELEADWAEKQLKKQEEAQKKALESRIDALEATEEAYEAAMGDIRDALDNFNSEYLSALEEVANNRDSLAGELSDFALFDDFEGDMHLWDLGPMIDQINAYGDAITGLRERGVNEGLLSEILDMDRENAARFANELLDLSDSQFESYMAMWQEKEDAAARVASAVYQGDMEAIEAEYSEKLPEMMGEAADTAMETLTEHLEDSGQDAVAAIADIADEIIAEIERINAAQRLQMAVQSASASFGGKLSSNVQNAAEGDAASRRGASMEAAGAVAMVSNASTSREIVLNLNGKEVARGLVPDIRAVEDQSPRIVSD